MNTLAQQHYQPLIWIKPELDKTITNIRILLEEYSLELENSKPLEKISQELHMLKGSLEILEFFGASLLVKDMAKAISALIDNTVNEKNDVFEALLQATLSIEAYIDKLHWDQSDIPLALLPVMNDIRASINEPLLSQSALFLPNLSIVPKTPDNMSKEQDEAQLQESAKTLRPYYQAALLTWFNNPTDQLSIQQLKLVVRNLESVSVTSRNRQIWWILGGIFEALSDKGLKSNIALRLILGQADRIIKKLGESSEDIYDKNPPTDFLKNALYYISQASSTGKRVVTLKRVYQLNHVIPSEKDLSILRASLNAPNSSTLLAITKELKKSLDQSKSVIDNFARNTPDDTKRLESVITPLKLISDTLTLLSLSDEKNILNQQIHKITNIVRTGIQPNKETLLSIATSLLQLDSALQNITKTSRKKQDWQQGKTKTQTGDYMSNNPINNLPETEYRLLIIKTATEAKHNITEVKNNILVYLASEKSNNGILNNIPLLLSEIQGALIISNNAYAANIVEALNLVIKESLLEGTEGDIDKSKENLDLDLLAESIVSIEYYLEAIAEERFPVTPLLNSAQASLSKLGYPVPPPKASTKTIPSLEAVVTHISEAPPRLKVNALSLPKMDASVDSTEKNVFSISPDEIDPEVVEIFTEEAFEELADMAKGLQTLKLNPQDEEALTNIRRAFHTLKGSGRIAGANDISNFSGIVEKYVGRIICGALTLDQGGISLLNNSQQFLFELADCFKKNNPAPEELEILTMAIEHAMKSGIDVSTNEFEQTTNTNNIPELKNQAQESTYSVAEVDTILHSAVTQLSIIEAFIKQSSANADTNTNNPAKLDVLLEAVLKLHQSAEKTHITEFIQTTDLLSKYFNNISKNNTPINAEFIDILKEFSSTTYEILFDLPKLLNVNVEELKYAIEILPPEPSGESAPVIEHQLAAPALTPKLTQELLPESPSDLTTNLTPDSASNLGKTTEDHNPKSKQKEELDEDLDLINIFMEEAIELLAKGNVIIGEFSENKDDNTFLASTQRLLHTMKGSARMAGVTSVGNLSHTLESLIELIINKSSSKPDNLVDLIQNTYDAINDIVEDIMSDNEIRTHYDLLEEVELLLHPQSESKDNDSEVSHTPLKQDSLISSDSSTAESNIEPSHTKKTTIEENEQSIDDSVEPQISQPSTASAIVNALIKSHQDETGAENNLDGDLDNKSNVNSPSNIETITPQQDNDLTSAPEEILSTEPKSASKKELLIENVRVDANTLDNIINSANEGSATNLRIGDHITDIKSNLLELDKTISRSLLQMRDLQFETQKNKNSSAPGTGIFGRDTNDLNVFSAEQQNIQRLMESIGDIENIHSSLTKSMLETDNLVHQQKKLQSRLYEDLLDTRLVKFSVQTQRIQRILRQTCKSLHKKAKLTTEGTDGAIDRSLLEKLMGPIEHIIRNSVAHGIEVPKIRKDSHKSQTGNVTVNFSKEKSEHVITITDDGAGINIQKVQEKAIKLGLVEADEFISNDDIKHLIFESGFSTSDDVSQISGRGIGMDVVLNDIQQLGGTVNISSQEGTGSSFIIRVPFTSSRNHTLLVTVGNNTYALPSTNIVHSFAIKQQELEKLYLKALPSYQFESDNYPLWHMDALLNETETFLPAKQQQAFVVLVKHNNKLLALQVDAINETRDSVLQPINPQLTGLQGIAGTTVLGDGKVVLILDIPALIKLADSRNNKPTNIIVTDKSADNNSTIKALIVDDSVTVRKVTERFLNRHGMETSSAKDGVEALEKIEISKPDIVLLDIEMPNMDGLELAKAIKSDGFLHNTPIIMITSRTGQQHRQKASEIGVEVFLGKPYQESELLGYIQALTGKRTNQKV